MIDSLYIAATGLHAQQLQVDTIANNLANAGTPGFKRSRVSFEDVMYREVQRANGLPGSEDNQLLVGSGVGVSGVRKQFAAGELKKTDNPFDVAIRGDGFLEALRPDGRPAYTRTGRLAVNREGLLATAEGYPLSPSISVPPDAHGIEITPDGLVQATFGSARQPQELGQIELVAFANPAGLLPLGGNQYAASEDAGLPVYGQPGQDGRGLLAQGFLETSNVRFIDEMVDLLVAQRAYESVARVVQASDELMSMSNNLRR